MNNAIENLANDLITFMEQNDTDNHGKRVAENSTNREKLVAETAEMLRTGNTTYIVATLKLFAECNPDLAAATLLNRIYKLETAKSAVLTPTKKPSVDISKRYTLPDEEPCNFCDCNMPGAVCPYRGKSDTEIAAACRIYLYFQLLQEYENQKFDN